MAALVLLGMMGYFAGVVQAPITAFVIVTEMTNDHAMVIPLMTAAFIGHAASRLVCHEGVYHALSKNFLAAARSLELSLPRPDQETAPAEGRTGAPPPPANLVG